MKKILALALTLMTSTSLWAAGQKHEVEGGSSAQLLINDNSQVSFSGGYRYDLSQALSGLQVGGQINFMSVSKASSFELIFIGDLNFPQGQAFASSFFAGAALGFVDYGDTDFYFDIHAGKRFQLMENVYWKPYAAFVLSPDFALKIVPVSISVLFDRF